MRMRNACVANHGRTPVASGRQALPLGIRRCGDRLLQANKVRQYHVTSKDPATEKS